MSVDLGFLRFTLEYDFNYHLINCGITLPVLAPLYSYHQDLPFYWIQNMLVNKETQEKIRWQFFNFPILSQWQI